MRRKLLLLATFFFNLEVANSVRSFVHGKWRTKKHGIHFNGLTHTFFDSSSHSNVVAVGIVTVAVGNVFGAAMQKAAHGLTGKQKA